ncbi:unnamed protein product, partial [Didymodactylos carnosus]
DGSLSPGDQIVGINEHYLDSKDLSIISQAVHLLLHSKGTIDLVIARNIKNLPHGNLSKDRYPTGNVIPFNVDMVLNTEWTQIEVIELINDGSASGSGTGLGFGIIGNKSTGVIVKNIVPGGIVDKDGRIHTGDHIFQINHLSVRGMSSEQVAGILRCQNASNQVRLVVARSVRDHSCSTSTITTSTANPIENLENSPIIVQNDGINTQNDSITTTTTTTTPNINNGYIVKDKILLRTKHLLEGNLSFEKLLENLREQCAHEDGTELLDVTLEKGEDGLGITVAGYVSADSTNNDAISGIFIRDIASESVCAKDGRLSVGDQIVEVNEQSLNGFPNVQALQLLRGTTSSVRLKVRRYLDGVKHEKIKEMIALESSQQLQELEEKIEFQSPNEINEQIRQKWLKLLGGDNYEILIADVVKSDVSGLGITLEGTVDVENGEEVRPHHYIRALLRDGSIGLDGTLMPGDELLEVNNHVLYGKNHIHVIEILKHVKNQVKLICARKYYDENHAENNRDTFSKTAELIVKAKSMGTLDESNRNYDNNSNKICFTHYPSLIKPKSRSLEVISNLAMWSNSVTNVELKKEDFGLGFSVLDYNDPSQPNRSPVIVIRALVPGGVAQLDGRITPGDRLLAVNGIQLDNMGLDEAIKILKSIPRGIVKLSLSKPLPYPKSKDDELDDNRLNSINKSKMSKTPVTNGQVNHSDNIFQTSDNKPTKINQIVHDPAVSPGIALSAPAILNKEYFETLLSFDKPKHTKSTFFNYHPHKIDSPLPEIDNEPPSPVKFFSNDDELLDLLEPVKRNSIIFNRDHELTTSSTLVHDDERMTQQEEINISSFNHKMDEQPNLPEFVHFQSDHLVLMPTTASLSFYDRLRGPSAFSYSRFNRQTSTLLATPLATTTTTTGVAAEFNPITTISSSSSRSNKRSSATDQYYRNRQQRMIEDEDDDYDEYLIRSTMIKKKFEPLTCFHEPDYSGSGSGGGGLNNINYRGFRTVDPTTINRVPFESDDYLMNKNVKIDYNDGTAIISATSQKQTGSSPPINTTPTTPPPNKWNQTTRERQSPRMTSASPALSTSSQSSGRVITFLNREVIQFPSNIEREIRIKQNFEQLGLIVDAYIDEGVNGCIIKSIMPSEYGLKAGDYILSINNENMKKISNAQAKSVVRRASLMGSDISIVYIPSDEANLFREYTLEREHELTQHSTSPPGIYDSDIEQTKHVLQTDNESYGFEPSSLNIHSSAIVAPQQQHCIVDSETLSATLWGCAREVLLYRQENSKSLGISIVGGKLDFSGPNSNSIESCISGIFIKHVLPNSPAGANGTLKTGDRILDVNGYDLREASHDKAVEIIRAAKSPVCFIVQSLLDPSNPSSDNNTIINTTETLSSLSTNIPLIPSTFDQRNAISLQNTNRSETTIHRTGAIIHNAQADNNNINSNTDNYDKEQIERGLLKQYGHLDGDIYLIDIYRQTQSEPLGLSLIGHRDPQQLAVFVCDIQPNSLLDRDNRIQIGDQLLEVNGEILYGKAHSAVIPIIKSIKSDILNFVILRNPNALHDMAIAQLSVNRTPLSVIDSPIPPSTIKSSSNYMPDNKTSNNRFVTHESLSSSSSLSSPLLPPQSKIQMDDVSIDEFNSELKNSMLVMTNNHQQQQQNEQQKNDDFFLNNNNERKKKSTFFDDIEEKKNDITNSIVSTNDEKYFSENHIHPFSSNIKNIQNNDRENNKILTLDQKLAITTTKKYDDNNSENIYLEKNMVSVDDNNHQKQLLQQEVQHSRLTNDTQKDISPEHQQLGNISPNSSILDTTNHNILSTYTPSEIATSFITSKDNKTILPEATIDKNYIQIKKRSSSSSNSSSQSSPSTPPSIERQSSTKQKLSENIEFDIKNVINNQAIINQQQQIPSSNYVMSTSTNNTIQKQGNGLPRDAVTIILNKDSKGFGLVLMSQNDGRIWVKSVIPHGPADENDIRAGDEITMVNDNPVNKMEFDNVEKLLNDSTINRLQVTYVPYREPEPTPIAIHVEPSVNNNNVIEMVKTNIADDPRTRPIVVGQETLIEIDRGRTGLGLSVVGGSDTQLGAIVIHDIYEGCAAQRDGRLFVGDQILAVNNIDMKSATHEEAIHVLRQAADIVRILVLRGTLITEMMNEQEKFDIVTIDLTKKTGKGLGFSIIGRKMGFGVFISHILEGGLAEKDGRLMSGDLILEVNGQDLRKSPYEHVAYTLKTLPHGKVTIKIGRLKASSRNQSRQNSIPGERKSRSRSISSHTTRRNSTNNNPATSATPTTTSSSSSRAFSSFLSHNN